MLHICVYFHVCILTPDTIAQSSELCHVGAVCFHVGFSATFRRQSCSRNGVEHVPSNRAVFPKSHKVVVVQVRPGQLRGKFSCVLQQRAQVSHQQRVAVHPDPTVQEQCQRSKHICKLAGPLVLGHNFEIIAHFQHCVNPFDRSAFGQGFEVHMAEFDGAVSTVAIFFLKACVGRVMIHPPKDQLRPPAITMSGLCHGKCQLAPCMCMPEQSCVCAAFPRVHGTGARAGARQSRKANRRSAARSKPLLL